MTTVTYCLAPRKRMHAVELTELAAIVASHATVITHGRQPILATAVEPYWRASRKRIDCWNREFQSLEASRNSETSAPRPDEVRPLLEDVLLSEVLTRIWTATATLHDKQHGGNLIEPISRSVFLGHQQARNKSLRMLVTPEALPNVDAVAVNRVRRRAERWTDLLLGYLALIDDVSEFAFDECRCREFAQDLKFEQRTAVGSEGWQLTMTALRSAFARGVNQPSPQAALNQAIAAGIIQCFPADTFDCTGVLKTLWQVRLESTADHTQGMVEELLSLDASAPPSKSLRRARDAGDLF